MEGTATSSNTISWQASKKYTLFSAFQFGKVKNRSVKRNVIPSAAGEPDSVARVARLRPGMTETERVYAVPLAFVIRSREVAFGASTKPRAA